jgi:O-antigen/teichoic acid export membrane protein
LVTEKSYWGAYVVVPILVLSYIVDSFRLHFNIGILIKKKTKLFLLINLATAALNLALNYFLIKEFHMWGAAWATLLAFIFRSSVTYYLSNRMVKIELETWRLMKAFAVAGLMYWPISMIETGQPLLNLAVKSVVCLAYPVVLLSIGLFEPKEIAKAKEYSRALYQKLLKKFRRKERNRKYQDESVERKHR